MPSSKVDNHLNRLLDENKNLVDSIENLQKQIKLSVTNFALRYDNLFKCTLDLIRQKYDLNIDIDVCDLAQTLLSLCSDSSNGNSLSTQLTCPSDLKQCLEQLCCPYAPQEDLNVESTESKQTSPAFGGWTHISPHLGQRCCLGGDNAVDRLLKQLALHRQMTGSKINLPYDQVKDLLSSLDPDENPQMRQTLDELVKQGPTLYDLHWSAVEKKSRKGIGSCEAKLVDFTSTNNNQLAAEIAFQLDRRILNFIFRGEQSDGPCEVQSLYGLSVNSIPEMIVVWSFDLETGDFDMEMFNELKRRYGYLMRSLGKLGYDECYHPKFCIKLINTFGISSRPFTRQELCTLNLDKWNFVRAQLQNSVQASQVKDILIIFDALLLMVEADKKALFRF